MIRYFIFLWLVLVAYTPMLGQRKSWIQASPSGCNTLYVYLKEDGHLKYTVSRNGVQMLALSSLGLLLQDETELLPLVYVDEDLATHDEIWTPKWGKKSLCQNYYNEIKLFFKQKGSSKRLMNIIFRVYDDGIAFRYEICSYDEEKIISINKDCTSFSFSEDNIWWAHNGEQINLGPNQISNFPNQILPPLLVRYPNNSFIAIHEAEIDSLSNFVLKKCRPMEVECFMYKSKAILPCLTSWRTIFIVDNEKELISSNLLQNLNSDCPIRDTSWIKPGKTTWNWRAQGYVAEDGFKYDIGTETQIRFIDFAAENNIKYHTIDANWYGPEFEKDSNPMMTDENTDIRYIMSYAKEKGVGIFLYLNDLATKKYNLDDILSTFKRLGAVGVKYGFMTGIGQEKVLKTREVIRKCAQHQLMLIFHDHPIPPSGDYRTWPHVLAREYGLAQGDNKIAAYPRAIVNQVFIQSLCGPLDMSNGWFDLNNAGKRSRVFDIVPSTVIAELAKVIVIFTGFNCFPDVPEEYKRKANLLQLLRQIPHEFDSYQVLSAEIDSHISVARKKGNEWFIASLTIEEPRNINIVLDFLDDDKIYEAYFYEDTSDAHYLRNKESYAIYKKEVRKGDKINIKMVAGGGSCIHVRTKRSD